MPEGHAGGMPAKLRASRGRPTAWSTACPRFALQSTVKIGELTSPPLCPAAVTRGSLAGAHCPADLDDVSFARTGSSLYDNVNPLPVNERIASLDVVRGFALLGMLIANMPGFSTSFFAEADGSDTWPSLLDKSAAMVHDMLFAGKLRSGSACSSASALPSSLAACWNESPMGQLPSTPAGCLRSWHSV